MALSQNTYVYMETVEETEGQRHVTSSRWGCPKTLAMQAGNTRRGHWFATHTVAINMAMTKKD